MLRRPARAQLLVDTWLEDPSLPARVQELGGAELATMVREIGLEDAGPLLALVRPDQLLELFDEDLFHGEVGERERLDPARFATWLEVLLESRPASAAARFAALDEDFVAHALGGCALVLAEDELRLRLEQADEDEAHDVEQALESALELALDGYLDLREALLALPANLRAVRTRELVYLANVLVAGAADDGERFSLERALKAASLTVELGRRLRATPGAPDPLRVTPADVLFRHASTMLAGSPRSATDSATDTGVAAETEVDTADDPTRTATQTRGFLVSEEELAIWGAK